VSILTKKKKKKPTTPNTAKCPSWSKGRLQGGVSAQACVDQDVEGCDTKPPTQINTKNDEWYEGVSFLKEFPHFQSWRGA